MTHPLRSTRNGCQHSDNAIKRNCDAYIEHRMDGHTLSSASAYGAKESLQRMVRIRERDEPIAAPLTPDQQYYLQQNMHLMLEQAQVALLREQTELYQHSLKRVAEWLDQYLVIEDERTLAARAALAELADWTVDPERPDISGSLTQLQKLVEQQRRGSVTAREETADKAPAEDSQ